MNKEIDFVAMWEAGRDMFIWSESSDRKTWSALDQEERNYWMKLAEVAFKAVYGDMP